MGVRRRERRPISSPLPARLAALALAALALCAGCTSYSPDGPALPSPAGTALDAVTCQFLAADHENLDDLFNGESTRPQEAAALRRIAQGDVASSPVPLVRQYAADLDVMAGDLQDASASLTAHTVQVVSDYQAILSACGG